MANTNKFDGRAEVQFSRLAECPDTELKDEFIKLCAMIKSRAGAVRLIKRQPGKPATKIRKRLEKEGLL